MTGRGVWDSLRHFRGVLPRGWREERDARVITCVADRELDSEMRFGHRYGGEREPRERDAHLSGLRVVAELLEHRLRRGVLQGLDRIHRGPAARVGADLCRTQFGE